MPIEAEIEELIQKCKDRAEDSKLIHLKAVDGSKVEAIKAQKRLEKEIRKQGTSHPHFIPILSIQGINADYKPVQQQSQWKPLPQSPPTAPF